MQVMRELGYEKCRRFVFLGTTGVGSSRGSSTWVHHLVVDRSNLKITFDDHLEVQRVLEEEGKRTGGVFEWVDVRAAGLSNGAKKPVREFGDDGMGVAKDGKRLGWFPMISRESVAVFLVDAVESGEWNGRTPVIAN